VNGIPAGEFQVAKHGGFLMFDNRTGRVQLRDITLGTSGLDDSIPTDIMRFEDLEAAGGTRPKVLLDDKPRYTAEAMRMHVEGQVGVEAVVMPDGSVGATRVIRSLHPDLDVTGVVAVKAWKFQPAVLHGKAIPLVVEVELTFTVK
jgi:TonB family protein